MIIGSGSVCNNLMSCRDLKSDEASGFVSGSESRGAVEHLPLKIIGVLVMCICVYVTECLRKGQWTNEEKSFI